MRIPVVPGDPKREKKRETSSRKREKLFSDLLHRPTALANLLGLLYSPSSSSHTFSQGLTKFFFFQSVMMMYASSFPPLLFFGRAESSFVLFFFVRSFWSSLAFVSYTQRERGRERRRRRREKRFKEASFFRYFSVLLSVAQRRAKRQERKEIERQ